VLSFPRTSVSVAVKYLKSVLPDVDAVIKHMESSGGWLGLPPEIVNTIDFLRVADYVELYEDELRSLSIMWRLVRSAGNVRAAPRKVNIPSQEELNKAFDRLHHSEAG